MLTRSKPEWLRVRPPAGESYAHLKTLLRGQGLHTVCEEARCPNVAECWGGGTTTVMLLGDLCTRGCRFCAVESGNPRGLVDPEEPDRAAAAIAHLGLGYVVLTSVDRDDLPDGGAAHFARTIRAIRAHHAGVLVEALIPDFQGDPEALRTIVEARPDVLGHNVETVRRLQPLARDPRAGYDRSLGVLGTAKALDPGLYTKSSLMLGLGETRDEVLGTMADLRAKGVDLLTLGQYLRPSDWHLPVREYVSPGTFDAYRRAGEALGFLHVAAGPLVRSSYRAGEFFLEKAIRGRRAERQG